VALEARRGETDERALGLAMTGRAGTGA
jgi:hypothetical protein